MDIEGNCPADSAGGYLWPATSPGTQMTANCDSASLRFVSQLNPELRRYCSSNGTWSDVDYTGCTLTQPAVPFLLIWYTLQTNNVSEVTRNGPTLELQVYVRRTSVITCTPTVLLISCIQYISHTYPYCEADVEGGGAEVSFSNTLFSRTHPGVSSTGHYLRSLHGSQDGGGSFVTLRSVGHI